MKCNEIPGLYRVNIFPVLRETICVFSFTAPTTNFCSALL